MSTDVCQALCRVLGKMKEYYSWNPLQRPPWGQKKVAIVERLKQEWWTVRQKMAVIEIDVAIVEWFVEVQLNIYIILLLVNKNYGKLCHTQEEVTGWVRTTSDKLQSSSAWFGSCCGHLPDLFLVTALIVNSFNGCLQCQLGFLILLRSNCWIICFHNDLRGVPVEIAGMHAKCTFHNNKSGT